MAICYHQNDVVQGYDLLKTDNIFHSKGLSEDVTPFFYPEIVQEHGHSVLRFLQENFKQDRRAYWVLFATNRDNLFFVSSLCLFLIKYWSFFFFFFVSVQLFKNAGEDNIQLFVSVIQSHATNSCDDDYTFRPSLINRGRSDSLLSLRTPLYRVAQKLTFIDCFLSLSLSLGNGLSWVMGWCNFCTLLNEIHLWCFRYISDTLNTLMESFVCL